MRGSLPPGRHGPRPGRTLASGQAVSRVTAGCLQARDGPRPTSPGGWLCPGEAGGMWGLRGVRGGQTPHAPCGAHGAGVGLEVAGPRHAGRQPPERAALVPPDPREDGSRPPISQTQESSGVTPGSPLITPRQPPIWTGLSEDLVGNAPLRSPRVRHPGPGEQSWSPRAPAGQPPPPAQAGPAVAWSAFTQSPGPVSSDLEP